ncbi:hypothetical protein [Rhodococcus gordoniae]|uniref:hypothetical protein n=1 Tax=Rhodococcus gordoniae TaxID=223392 RepID=UPI0020CEB6F8|nr:hypothetical protein [Rhodococcus gordoniae]UTT50935.1 hypothetical protein NMQ04_21555 [Rhodococcus gordoniae]
MVSLSGPLLERAEKSSSDHLSGQAEVGQDSSRTFEDSNGHARAVCKHVAGGRHAAARAKVRKGRHRYRDGKDPLGIGVMASADISAFLFVEQFADLPLPLHTSRPNGGSGLHRRWHGNRPCVATLVAFLIHFLDALDILFSAGYHGREFDIFGIEAGGNNRYFFGTKRFLAGSRRKACLLFRAWGTLRRTRHGKSLRGAGDLGKEIPGQSA